MKRCYIVITVGYFNFLRIMLQRGMKQVRVYFAAVLFFLVVIGYFQFKDPRVMLDSLNREGHRDIKELISSATQDPTGKFAEISEKARELQKNAKVLCFTMTTPYNIDTKALAVNSTWGRRCTKLLFFTTQTSTLPNVVSLDVIESRSHLTMKTVKTLEYLYENYIDKYDWFFKADDDVYVIMENLRYLLSHHDSNTPVYMGHQFRLFTKQGYMSGGAGYIMSNKAVRLLNENGFKKAGMCEHDGNDEDLDIGKCFDKIGVKPYSTVDKFGRQTFHPFGLHKAISGNYHNGESYYLGMPYKPGTDCCSQLSISFHYVNPDQMYLIETLLYGFKVYGRTLANIDNSFFTKNVSVITGKQPDEIILNPGQFLFFHYKRSHIETSSSACQNISNLIVFFIFSFYLIMK